MFAAWAEPAAKASWFAGGAAHALDFSVGGRETALAEHDGKQIAWETTYAKIVPGEHITYTSTMHLDGRLSTASLTTVGFVSTGDATRLVFTEHGAYLDGQELPERREEGTAQQLDTLGKVLT